MEPVIGIPQMGGGLFRAYMKRKYVTALRGADARVNSLHHQAVDALGPGLMAAAVSEDCFIEGTKMFGHPFCIGVQWHPEHMCKHDSMQKKLFDAFVEACR